MIQPERRKWWTAPKRLSGWVTWYPLYHLPPHTKHSPHRLSCLVSKPFLSSPCRPRHCSRDVTFLTQGGSDAKQDGAESLEGDLQRTGTDGDPLSSPREPKGRCLLSPGERQWAASPAQALPRLPLAPGNLLETPGSLLSPPQFYFPSQRTKGPGPSRVLETR